MFIRNSKNKKNILTANILIFCCIGFFLLLPNSIFAKSLEKYKEDINHLKTDFASMLTEETDSEFEKEVFAEIAKLLPAEEKIEVGEITIDVNNKWLSVEIEKYKAKTDEKEKNLILTGIYERLDAIELKISELENSVSNGLSKDEEKRKLAEILSREEYQKPVEEEESLLQRIMKWLDEWLNRNLQSPNQKPLPASSFGQIAYIFQILLYILVFAVIGFLIYKFAPFFIKKYRQREKSDKNERIILGEKISVNETSENLFSEAEKLAQAGNLRDAIRKGYIAFLFELSNRKLIGLAKHKTNRDYLRSVRKKQELYKNMSGLTLNYERHWYGFETADEKDWEEFRDNYKKAISKE